MMLWLRREFPIGLGLKPIGRPQCIHIVLQKGSYWCSRNRIEISKAVLSVTTNKKLINNMKIEQLQTNKIK